MGDQRSTETSGAGSGSHSRHVQHCADVQPSATISCGSGPVATLPFEAFPVAALPVADGAAQTVREVINGTDTDAWLVLHHGKLVAEEYLGHMSATTPHRLMSVSKSLVGTVAGALEKADTLDLSASANRYVPELTRSGYANATVRQLLDMRSGIAFSEDYLNPVAELRQLETAIDWTQTSGTIHDVLLSLDRKTHHGGPFEYRSCETDVLVWVCEAAAGMPMPELMSELLWSRIGAEDDATVSIDPAGTGIFDGGITARLHDLARFGMVYLQDGASPTGQEVVSPAWIADTIHGGTDSRAAFAASPNDTQMPGGMYRNQFWLPYPDDDVLLCLGIHGQLVYLNQTADVVAVKLSSWPQPQDATKLTATLHAFDTVSWALAGTA